MLAADSKYSNVPLWGVFLIQTATFLHLCCLYWVKTLRLEGIMQGNRLEEAGEGG